jgi:hypothetical protein
MYIVLTSSNSRGLESKVNEHLKEGFTLVGSLNVVTTHSQNRFRGSQHMDTLHEVEYSQAMIKGE